ncbi:MAG TPA: SRPBCC family protein [Roseiarcus sp.]|nr:SRPBCC family protein [Roseiarcus sp.]
MRIIAYDRINPGVTLESVQPYLKEEVSNVWRLWKTMTVNASPARAFDVFTGRMIRWWRPDHHIGSSPMKELVLEPRVDGRWYEVGEDGSACDWGKVLAYEPPTRIVLAWQLNQDWKYDASFVTELEVRFVAEGTATRVELEHRNLDRFGARADALRADLDSQEGWTGALVAFAAYLDRVSQKEAAR